MWPITTLPSLVAGPVAANAEQCIGCGAGIARGWLWGKRIPSNPVGVAFNVEHDPAGLRIAIGGTVALDGARVGLKIRRPCADVKAKAHDPQRCHYCPAHKHAPSG